MIHWDWHCLFSSNSEMIKPVITRKLDMIKLLILLWLVLYCLYFEQFQDNIGHWSCTVLILSNLEIIRSIDFK